MSLEAPNLDDRRFQGLVDDAKRYVQQRCPEWTDHNVSDPGVTLIETFAFMADQLVYRLNQVPDKVYTKFLDLLDLRLYPPTAAKADVTFRLSAPQEEPVVIAEGTEVATPRTDLDEAVIFQTLQRFEIQPASFHRAATQRQGEDADDKTRALRGSGFDAFGAEPAVGDTTMIGLDKAIPNHLLHLRMSCEIDGVGVDPDWPPLVWEAWVGKGWEECDLEIDTTGGLNRAGDLELHIPAAHTESLVAGEKAGWIRCRVVQAVEGQPEYSATPKIESIEAATIGGTTRVINAATVENEVVGLSEGVPGQRFRLDTTPVVADSLPLVLEVAAGSGWDEWHQVQTFAESGPDDRVFIVDPVNGDLAFGPAVREPDGSLTQYGAVPPKGAPMRLKAYLTGGGRHGNAEAGKVTILRDSIPFVTSVKNRFAASGGVDAENLDDAKSRGSVLLRTRNRAVTAEDYEALARESSPEVARIRAVAAGDGAEAGTVRMLVVPSATDEDGRLGFEQLIPADETLERIAMYLDERRTIGTRVVVEPPVYQGIRIDARVKLRPGSSGDRVKRDAIAALYRYYHALIGGPERDGWPFGRPIHVGEVHSVLQRVDGVDYVVDALLRAADPVSGELSDAMQRIDIDKHALVFSYEHQVLVEGA